MVAVAAFLVLAVLAVGILFFRLHTLPERMAHRGHKLQFEIVAVLGLLALFTHMHIFWVAGLLLALIDFPDFGTPLRRMAGSLERMAGIEGAEVTSAPADASGMTRPPGETRDEHVPPAPGTKAATARPKPVPAPESKELTHV
jgi:hypothetical protein